MTTTGIQYHGDEDGVKMLPAITVCASPVYKVNIERDS